MYPQATWAKASDPDVIEEWPDVATLDAKVVTRLLKIAEGDVLAYAPKRIRSRALALGYIPEGCRLAQIRQARNAWRAGNIDGSGQVGDGEFVYTPHPLDWHVKQLIRPRRGAPNVG